jgi:hypothetical protein
LQSNTCSFPVHREIGLKSDRLIVLVSPEEKARFVAGAAALPLSVLLAIEARRAGASKGAAQLHSVPQARLDARPTSRSCAALRLQPRA